MKTEIIKIRFKNIFFFFVKSVIYPTLVYSILLGILILINRIDIEDLVEYQKVFIVIFLIIIAFSMYLLIEYSLFSLNRRIVVKDNTVTFLKGKKIVFKKNQNDICSFQIYGEIHNLNFFPWGSFRYCVITFIDNSVLTINCLQAKNLENVLKKKAEIRRDIFPSLILSMIFRG